MVREEAPLEESGVALPDGAGDGELPEEAVEGVTTLSNPRTVWYSGTIWGEAVTVSAVALPDASVIV